MRISYNIIKNGVKTLKIKGFIRAGFSPTQVDVTIGIENTGIRKGGITITKSGKAFLLLRHDTKNNTFEYKGIRFFNKNLIPKKYRFEFNELYERETPIFSRETESIIGREILALFT